MHPVNYLFEEINRDYWGIPAKPERPARKDRDLPAWRLPRFRRDRRLWASLKSWGHATRMT